MTGESGDDKPTTEQAKTVRLSVNLAKDVSDALKAMAAQRGVTVTEMVRLVISTQRYIDQASARGASILVSEPDGGVRELVFM